LDLGYVVDVRNVVDRGVVRNILHDGVLLNEGSRWTIQLAAISPGIKITEPMLPMRVRPITRPIVTVERIAAAGPEVKIEPADKSSPAVAGVKIVAEVIMIAAGVHEQRAQKAIVGDDIRRAVRPVRLRGHAEINGHRSEQQAALP
jgi:hypothetical protein